VKNFFTIFSILVDSWIIFDNSGKKPLLVAEKKLSEEIKVHNSNAWNLMKEVSQ